MELLQHTTYDEVRSLLGVTSRELPDATVALPHWTLQVEQELRDIDDGVGAALTQFATVFALAEGARTAAQTQFFNVLNMYVLYSVGNQILQRADQLFPQTLTDGKASLARPADRFDKLKAAMEGGLQRLRERLRDALTALGSSVVASVSRTMILGIGLGTDPVTGV